MITENDKIKISVEKYGIDENQARRIIKSEDCLLNIDEIRIKYDNPNLGIEYPEWLDPLDHYKMCCATVKMMYNGNFAKICSPEELASTLYIKTSYKLNKVNSHQHLKSAIVHAAMTICRDNMRRDKYWNAENLNAPSSRDSSITLMDTVNNINKDEDEIKCLNAVVSIKNREIRELLIIAGYVIGRLESFETEFKKIVENSKYIKRDKMVELLKMTMYNDDIEINKEKFSNEKFRKKPIKLSSILKVYKTDMDSKSARIEIGDYLKFTDFLGNSI